MASQFTEIEFDPAACRVELESFRQLLGANPELSERKQLLPFFKRHNQLSAFIGCYESDIGPAPLVSHEFSIRGDFTADALVGKRSRGKYLAVEFEDGRVDSIFRKTKRGHTEWSPRFEHGFSQLIDWYFALDDSRPSRKFQEEFGRDEVSFSGLLVVGRNAGVSESDRTRLRWRSRKVVVDSCIINCVTYDDLYLQLSERLQFYPSAGSTEKS